MPFSDAYRSRLEGVGVMDEPREEEIARFWAKSRQEIDAELKQAGLDAEPVTEAILKLLQEKSKLPLK